MQHNKTQPNYKDDDTLIDASELGKLIGRSTTTVKIDVSRRPETLPPRFIIPGTRKVMWRVKDVREWMEAIADEEKERHAAHAAAARKVNMEVPPMQSFYLGWRARGAKANERMKAKK